ncbi:MAG TPA: hypothetical protein VH599_19735 [Ktedonobacterales bacterium]
MPLVAPPSRRLTVGLLVRGLEGERAPWRSGGRRDGGATSSNHRSLVEPAPLEQKSSRAGT